MVRTARGGNVVVSPGDATPRWFGGGSGADSLTDGVGTMVFLVNANTLFDGRSLYNITIIEATRTQHMHRYLMKKHLQEVIGGHGVAEKIMQALVRFALALLLWLPVCLGAASADLAESFHAKSVAVCNSMLRNAGRATVIDKWLRPPLPDPVYRAISMDLGEHEAIDQWTSHENVNGTKTIIVQVRASGFDQRYWFIVTEDKEGFRLRNSFIGTDIEISTSVSGGMSSLYLCGIWGTPMEWVWSEWIWRGSVWKRN